MSYKDTPDAWKMDGLELSVEQKLNDVYDIASTAAAGALPSVSSADNGKALLVKSGKWQKAAIPSQLPTVSADDNGDVLAVVGGAWAKAEPPGGVYVVNAVTDEQTQIVTLDKTYREIETAYLGGKSVFILYTQITHVGQTPAEIYCKNLVIEMGQGDELSEVRPWIGLYTSQNAPFEYCAESLDAYPYYDPNE